MSNTQEEYPGSEYINSLSGQQWEAINTSIDVLVKASPGTGKTRTLIGKLLWLLGKGVSPRDITVCTFTKKAARELVERMQGNLENDYKEINVGTIHGMAYKVLRQCVQDAPQPVAEDMAKAIMGMKPRERWGAYKSEEFHAMGFCLHDDVVKLAMQTDPPASIRRQFSFLLLDECQDLTSWEYGFLKIMREGADGEAFYVGDFKQAIYDFRNDGFRIKEEWFAEVYDLSTSYRCSGMICNAAQEIWPGPMEPMEHRKYNGAIEICPQKSWLDVLHDYRNRSHINSIAILTRTNALANKATKILQDETGLDEGVDFQHVAKPPKMNHVKWLSLLYILDHENNRIGYQILKEESGKETAKAAQVESLRTNDPFWLAAQKIGIPQFGYTGCEPTDPISMYVDADEMGPSEDFSESVEAFVERRTNDAVQDYMDKGNMDPTGEIYVMTCHAAKGLEFDAVILFGADDGSFCPFHGFDEEARNLLYVTVSRARYECCLVYRDNANRVKTIQTLFPKFESPGKGGMTSRLKRYIASDPAKPIPVVNNLDNMTPKEKAAVDKAFGLTTVTKEIKAKKLKSQSEKQHEELHDPTGGVVYDDDDDGHAPHPHSEDAISGNF